MAKGRLVALTQKDFLVLERRADGHCINGVWTFVVSGERVTSSVRKLERAGLIDISYYAGMKAGVNITDKGRFALKPIEVANG